MRIKYLFMFLTLIFLTSCSSVKITDKDSFNGVKVAHGDTQNVANINAEIYGYYLFSYIPIITGDPNNVNSFKLFQDSVTLNNAHDMVTSTAKDLGATKTINTASSVVWTGSFTLWIFWLKDVKVSGVAVK